MSLSKSSFVFINSADRSSGTNTNFNLYLNSFDNLRGSTAISLEQFEMFDTQYPIRTGVNDQLGIDEGGGQIVVTIPEGSYDAPTMATTLGNLLTAATGNAYSAFYDTVTYKINIVRPIPDTFVVDSRNLASPVNKYIGFDVFQGPQVTGHTGTMPVRLSTELFVDIILDGWSNSNIHSGMRNNIFHRVPLLGQYGEYIHYQNTEAEDFTIIENELLNSITIKIINPDGTLYDMPPNHEVSLVLGMRQI